jgi:hypothetical protein
MMAFALMLTACSGSGRGGAATTAASKPAGPPAPTALPDWVPPALGVAGEDALLDVIGHDLTSRGFTYAFDDTRGTVTLPDGRVLDLSTVARAASTSDPTTWPGLVSRTLDALLAP